MTDTALPIELHCPSCGKMLARCRDVDDLEIRCGRCKAIVAFLTARKAVVLRPGKSMQ